VLLAVSGQNIAFLLIGVYGLAALLAVSRRPAQLLFLGVVAAYVLAVGWQPSVVRAGVAGVLASLAWLLARPGARWHFLALGALVLLAWTPATLLEPGFQLSFAAVGAIFVLAPRVERVLTGYPVPTRLASVLAVSAVCGAVTAPISWLHFGSVPLYTVPANAVAWPVTAPLLGLGLLAAVIEPVVPAAAVTLGWVNGWLAAYLVWCARLFAGLPYARVSSGAALLALTAAAGVVVAAAKGSARARWTLGFAVGLAALLLAWNQVPRGVPPPPTGLRVTFLDVGQGDSALLQVPEGAVLVDEGPPEAHVATRLRALGVGGLSLLVLTHPQRDHVGGAEEVLRELRVRALLDPALPFASPYEQRALAAARRRGVPLSLARSGGVYRLGRLVLRVLWPDAAGPAGEDPNDHAIVLLASYGAIDVLLTADAESNVTARLPLRPVEVLKVAHHGSADPGLRDGLRVLRPRIAVISVGADNDYGHPRRSTLAALEAVPGLRLYRTDLQGEVVVETDGRLLSVRAQR
jgi:competence protein ComEC